MMTIGKFAKNAGVGVETVRFYERKGLIKQPRRSAAGGFRSYQEAEVQKIRFIKRAQELGFSLKEIKELLEINAGPRANCDHVREKALTKLEEIDEKLRDLKRMKTALRGLERACGEGNAAMSCHQITECFRGECC